MNGWNFDPLELSVLALVGALYWRRARTLARRGRPAPRLRVTAFAAGLLTLFVALASPIDTIGEERLFSVHMLQHLLLGDIGALLLVLGLDGRLLRPLLRVRLVHRLRVLAHPLVALPLWAANFVVWHLPVLFDAALRNDTIHALQHSLFVVFGMLMWAALVEPLPGPAWFTAPWKVPYVLVMWLVMLVMSQVFIWSNHPYYIRYGVTDQKAGGGVMLVESMFTMLPALVWVLLKVLRESEARQRLVDAGVAPATATRAARYGRA
ncbi:MAG TPA: cytochrome c oxidase assembly protein [Candidatus Dormibacteraeota bacterium]|nr:cytochrome c oxidase assembly protein [Candidatus Dormibacteraeota bacterium]